MRRHSFLIFLTLITFSFSCESNEAEPSFDCNESMLEIASSFVSPATSCSIADGSIKVIAKNGREPYSYFLNDNPHGTADFQTLYPGIYNIRVKDGNGCEVQLENQVVLAKDFAFSATITNNSECVGGNGAVTINVLSGAAPFTFKFNSDEYTPSNTFKNLASGSYTIEVKDGNNCIIAASITIPQVTTGVSWTENIKPIIENSCATSGCHNGISRADLRIYEKAKAEAENIKLLTQNKSMPFDGSLSEEEIALIACWVNDGALEN